MPNKDINIEDSFDSDTDWPDIQTIDVADVENLVRSRYGSNFVGELQGKQHEKRWIGLDGRYVYLVPANLAESKRLDLERLIIEQLHAASCPVPQIIYSDPILQIREQVIGTTLYEGEQLVFGSKAIPDNRYAVDLRISEQGKRLAQDLGKAIAICHQTFIGREGELRQMGLERFWFNGQKIRNGLSTYLDARQRSLLNIVINRYDTNSEVDVFSHGDLHHHNFCMESDTGALVGIFDFGSCCIGARELDFKFQLANGYCFLDMCIQSYEGISGESLNRRSIMDHHILEAAENLIYALANPHHGIERCRDWLFSALDHLV